MSLDIDSVLFGLLAGSVFTATPDAQYFYCASGNLPVRTMGERSEEEQPSG